ncbi:MAG TPA: hypothetical protein PLV25_05240 [Opitutales bacterium]|nr:hypothetical protein [Opitutales bacterium]
MQPVSEFFLKNAFTEFKTIETPMRNEWSAYHRLIMRSQQSLSTKLKQAWRSYRHWSKYGQK